MFQEWMDETTVAFCSQVQGSVFAFVQSDEVSVLLIDFDPSGVKVGTAAWFDGNVQKMCSVGASTFTALFNDNPRREGRLAAMFDARVFTIPDPVEVLNYFIWRQEDATRNSIQAAAQSVFSDKECFAKNLTALKDMLLNEKGINWNAYPARCKRGALIVYDETGVEGTAMNKKTGEAVTFTRPKGWVLHPETPLFTSDEGRAYMRSLILRRD
jgi:tRNA(His) 5'-end guanylyltransferase